MAGEKSFHCKIYVNEDEVYSGDLSEVPLRFRGRIIDDLMEWSSTLGKRGLNELLYSHIAWYEEMGKYCSACGRWVDEAGEESETVCGACGEKPEHRYVYERNEKLDRIITCVGLITEIRVSGQ
jgi:hypothetical protein